MLSLALMFMVVEFFLVVLVVVFVFVLVVFLDSGRPEVGHWGKTLLTEVVFYCPPLHLILGDDILCTIMHMTII